MESWNLLRKSDISYNILFFYYYYIFFPWTLHFLSEEKKKSILLSVIAKPGGYISGMWDSWIQKQTDYRLKYVFTISVNALYPLVLAVMTQKLFPWHFLSSGSGGGALLNGLKCFLFLWHSSELPASHGDPCKLQALPSDGEPHKWAPVLLQSRPQRIKVVCKKGTTL